jgi:acetate kinase
LVTAHGPGDGSARTGPRRVLCLNSGSSSLKLAVWEFSGSDERLRAEGEVERIGLAGSRFRLRLDGGAPREGEESIADHAAAVALALEALDDVGAPPAEAVGHRVVHGGPDLVAPVRVDAGVLARLRRLVPWAPLHMPSEIAAIEAVASGRPSVPQVACFDTAFHRRMPELAQRLPLPRALWERGIRRYGFHGLSYEYVVQALGPGAGRRAVIAHLGNGASLAATRDGAPVDTTMGFTPLGGVMMGTRSGDLDPGLVFHLVREAGGDAAAVERLVSREAGLLGVSGSSPDMRTLLEARGRDAQAGQAVALFVYLVRKQIGAFAAALGGLDTLVFTGGIGERAAPVRQEICEGLAYLGVRVDPEANRRHADTISPPASACVVRVIPTQEELMIARHTRDVLASADATVPGGSPGL